MDCSMRVLAVEMRGFRRLVDLSRVRRLVSRGRFKIEVVEVGGSRRRSSLRPRLEVDDDVNLLFGSDPVRIEFTWLENEVRDEGSSLSVDQAEIRALRLSERAREKAVEERMSSGDVTHQGGCHCGKVKWKVNAPKTIVAWDCNCSDCSMRGNTHFIVPSTKFHLLGDSQSFITTYTFGSHTAKHTFCRICGITSFYIPRSNPDGVAVTVRCVDPGSLSHVEIRNFDGKNWESSYEQTSIASSSKE